MTKKLLGYVTLAVFFTSIFIIPGAAVAEDAFSFYGSVRATTAYVNHSKETNNIPYSVLSATNGLAPTADEDYTFLAWEMEKLTSRFGVRAKKDQFSGRIEIRPYDGSIWRHYYGVYNFGSGTLLMGQTWDPLFLTGTMAESLMFGGMNGAMTDVVNGLRTEQFKVAFHKTPVGMVNFALLKPNKAPGGGVIGLTAAKTEATIPALRLTLHSKPVGPVSFVAGTGYNAYTITDPAGESYDVDGWAGVLGGRFKMGSFGLNLNLWTGKNPNIFASTPHYAFANAVYDAASDKVEDATVNYGIMTSTYWQIKDNLKLQFDYGMRETETEEVTGIPGTELTHSNYTLTLRYKWKQMTIRPQIEYIEWGDLEYSNGTETDLGTSLIAGIYWQFDF